MRRPDLRFNPRRRLRASQSGRLFALFAPVLATGVIAVVLALAGAGLGFYREEMFVAAAAISGFFMLLATFLFYLQSAGRRVADAALVDSQARVLDIAGTVVEPIVALDENCLILFFNPAAERVFRWPRRAALGQHFGMLVAERERTMQRQLLEQYAAGKVDGKFIAPVALLTGLRANGEEFPMEVSASGHTESGRQVFTLVMRDATAAAEAERARASNEKRLKGILDSAMDGIITVDENQRIVMFNEAAEKVFGCPRSEALGAPLAWFIPPRFREAHEKHMSGFGKASASSRRMGETRAVMAMRSGGREFPIDAAISKTEEGGKTFYTVILRDVTERERAERELRQSREDLRDLSAAGDVLIEKERMRVARELHDELGQSLTSLKMSVSWLHNHTDAGHTASRRQLESMSALLDSTLVATKRIAYDLRPPLLDDQGLLPAANWLVKDFTQRSGIACTIDFADAEVDLREPQASAVFRMLQESLTNVARHAQANNVHVHLEVHGDAVGLSVRDDGRGFDPKQVQRKALGLRGMRERASILNGELTIDSSPGHGTRVVARIPLAGGLRAV